MIRNYGLKFSKPDPEAYVLGGVGSLPQLVIQEDGQWDNYLPVYEPQFNSFFDSFGCTVWGSQNVVETLIKKLTGVERNFSERFTYILAKIVPPGADPHNVLEVIREYGLIDNELLPMTSSMKRSDFLLPNPMSKELIEKGYEFQWEVKHEYVTFTSPEDRIVQMKNALRFSPLGVSVTAWIERNGVYVDGGQRNTHWCECFGWNAKGWKVFDSYDQSIKTVAFDHNIEVIKRYYLAPSTKKAQLSILSELLKLIGKLFGLIKPVPPVPPTPVTPPPQPITEPVGSLLIEWATAIRDFEGKPGDLSYRNNNPGNLKKSSGGFMKFKTWEAGWKALLDYLTRAATGKHKSYKPDFTLLQFCHVYAPTSDNNHPRLYAEFIAKRLNRPITTKIKDLI